MTTSGESTLFTGPDVVYPGDITLGSDDAMWFTNGDGNLCRITQSGVVTSYSLPYALDSLTAARNGDLWVTYPSVNGVGLISTKGIPVRTFTHLPIVGGGPTAAGPDGALWFMESNAIARITTTGQVTTYRVPDLGPSDDITAGPDGAMWFTDSGTNTIGRIATSVTPWIASKSPTSGRPGTLIVITGLNLSHATQVTFNGVPAAIVSDSATYVVATVPPGATSGRIAVTTPAGIAAGNDWFRVT
jgi:streptogramin lyase